MSRLTKEQIKKLSPAERKKRNKVLAYLATRRAAKRDGKVRTRQASKKTKRFAKQVNFKRTVLASTNEALLPDSNIELIEAKLAELKSVREREKELRAEIREAL